MEYVSQTPDEIKLYIVSGQCDIDQFLVLKQSSVVGSLFKLRFGILGASHFVTVETPNESITEICACTTGNFSQTNVILTDKNLTSIKNLPHCIENAVFLHTLTWEITNEDIGKKLWHERVTQAASSTHHLEYVFPGVDADDTSAKTELLARIYESKVIIQSLHTYPNVASMVLTTSEIILK